MKKISLAAAACGLIAVAGLGAGAVWAAAAPTDPQIAHIAHTAGVIDIKMGKLALKKTHNKAVHAFADEMVRDHSAVDKQALALVAKLKVTPEDNPTSQALNKGADAEYAKLSKLSGKAFDREYAEHEVAYHKQVNAALADTLIPSAHNAELKSLLETGLKLFREHQTHAEHLAHELH